MLLTIYEREQRKKERDTIVLLLDRHQSANIRLNEQQVTVKLSRRAQEILPLFVLSLDQL